MQFGDRPPVDAQQLQAVEVSPNVVEFHAPAMPPRTRTQAAPPSRPAPSGPISAGSTTSSRCEQAKRALKNHRARMRAGYPAEASNRLHDKERYLEGLVADYC